MHECKYCTWCLIFYECKSPLDFVISWHNCVTTCIAIWHSCDRASWQIFYNKPTRSTNFSNLFWKETLHVSDSSSVHHQKFFTGTTFHPDPACKLSANLYDIYHCCVYSEKLLMMERGTVRNMWSFLPK